LNAKKFQTFIAQTVQPNIILNCRNDLWFEA